MLHFFTGLLLVLHGLIHSIGFVKPSPLQSDADTSVTQQKTFGNNIAKPLRLLWILTALLFCVTAIFFYWPGTHWWMIAFPSVLISQVLIIFYWQRAKAGTVINTIIFLIAMVAFAEARFNASVDAKAKELFRNEIKDSGIVTGKLTDSLPLPVRNWLLNSGIIGKPAIYSVRLKQQALMRLNPSSKKWIRANAIQYFTTNKPAFIWKVKVKMFPVTGYDLFENGTGKMHVSVGSLVNIVNATGPKINEGALQRYLAEICWFPSAALHKNIRWQAIDSGSAKATLTVNGISGTVVFHFKNNQVTGCTANRYKEHTANAKREKWVVDFTETTTVHGITIPVQCKVTWKLNNGDFTWYRLTITDIAFNYPDIYQ